MTEVSGKECPVCHKVFTRKPKELSSAFNRRIYCSRVCYGRTRCVPKLTFVCENVKCGKLIEKTPNKAKRATHHLCSKACKNEWEKIHRLGMMAGPNHPLYGKPRPQSVRNKISAKLKGNVPWNKGLEGAQQHSVSTKLKMSLASRGKKKSKKHKKNIKLAKLGPKNPQYGKIPWNFGIPCSPETIEKVREARLFQEITRDTKPEKLLHAELAKRGIEFQKNIYIDGRPDIFILPDVCIFVDGDYHHANPSKHKPNNGIFGNKIVKEIWKHDIDVTSWLSEMEFKVFRFWSSEVEKDPASCIDKVLKSL